MLGASSRGSMLASFLIGGLLLIGIYAASFHSYLLFHVLVESFSIVVSFSIFLFAWNSYDFVRSGYLFVLGTAYLFIGGFDFLHMLSYKGMNIFAIEGANISTQTWIIARSMEGASLFAFPFFINRRLNRSPVILVYTSVSALFFASVFVFPVFPDCYLEGTGLTVFKRAAEYAICAVLAGAGIMLYRRRQELHMIIYRLLMASIGTTIAAELAFTLYTDVYGTFNLVGHLFKVVSFYFVYRAILSHGLLKPYRSMFRELAQNRAALEKYSKQLEDLVSERTEEIEARNLELRDLSRRLMNAEEDERRRIARDLHDSIGQSLSAIKFYVENSVCDLGNKVQPEDCSRLQGLVPMIKTAISDVRRIIRNLRPSVLDELGIVATINWLCREFNSVYTGISIEKRIEMEDHHLPDRLKTPVFRLLQEALNNIGKHSSASSVRISLFRENGKICFEVEDDGVGFNPEISPRGWSCGSGLGLGGMRERAELSGAEFSIDSSPGRGTRIRAVWQEEEAHAEEPAAEAK